MSEPGKRKSTIIRIAMIVLILGIIAAFWVFASRPKGKEPQVQLTGLPQTSSEGFARITGPMALSFPLDHGSHTAYQTEWWYYTGNLIDESGRRFGYQLTFFRRGLVVPTNQTPDLSDWRADQVYFAHFALTDVVGKHFSYRERFSRGAAGLAGANGDASFSVWLEDWSVKQTGEKTYQLRATAENTELDLILVDQKGIVLQGDRGFSPKGSEPGNASMYYSQTRLATTGEIVLEGNRFAVTGSSWMDHEFSTSALSAGQVGWDWFSMQFDDGSELMLFNLRRDDGTLDAFSAGTWITADGKTSTLSRNDFEIIPNAEWKSPHSGATYPASWQVRVPSQGLEFTVRPLLADQELNLSFTYWEGAVSIQGSRNGLPITGFGYVELTGYSKSMQGQF